MFKLELAFMEGKDLFLGWIPMGMRVVVRDFIALFFPPPTSHIYYCTPLLFSLFYLSVSILVRNMMQLYGESNELMISVYPQL